MNAQHHSRQYPIFRDQIGQTMVCVGRTTKVAKIILIDLPAGREQHELVAIDGDGVKVTQISASKFEEFKETGCVLSEPVTRYIEASKKFDPKAAITIHKETEMVATKAVAKTPAAKAAVATPALKAALATLDKGDKKANEAELAAKKSNGAKKPALTPAQVKGAAQVASKNGAKAPAKTPAEIKKAAADIKSNMTKGAKPAAAAKPAKAPKVDKPKVDVAFALGCASVANLKETAKITVVAKANPKKEGTPSHAHFKLYKDGMTVADLLKKGGSRVNLGWDIAYGFVKAK